jgi:exodeoxyribonuclease VII large subunit
MILAPTLVQGEDAPAQVADALDRLGRVPGLDVAIVARGGGSIEDLWAFNEEVVARAIFRCPVPVISGVGHETDITIADLVADVRAPTPSGAAEMLTPDVRELLAIIQGTEDRMQSALAGCFQDCAHRVASLVGRVQRAEPDIEPLVARASRLIDRATHTIQRRHDAAGARLGADSARIEALSPGATLARGYARVEDEATGEVVRSKDATTTGQRLRVHVDDGAFPVEVI